MAFLIDFLVTRCHTVTLGMASQADVRQPAPFQQRQDRGEITVPGDADVNDVFRCPFSVVRKGLWEAIFGYRTTDNG